MELIRKKLLPPGEYHAPQGVYAPDRDRMRRQVAKFKRLKSEGYVFPVPWGHRLSAIPERRTVSEAEWQRAVEQRQFEEARYNASYIDDLRIDKDGDLEIILPVPPGYCVDQSTGDIINPSDGTRIREVSGAFGDWTDGDGRTHRDILIHAALCVRPVWGKGQPGFSKAENKTLATAIGNWHSLSTGAVRYTQMGTGDSSMAKEDEDIDDIDIEEEDDLDDDDEPVETIEETVTPAQTPVKVRQPDMFEQAMALLNQAGLTLPAHTTEENAWENIVTALTVALSMGAKFEREPDTERPPPATAQASTEAPPPTPEAPPVMMATVAKMPDSELAKHGLQRIKPVMLSTDRMSDREKVWAERQQKEVRKRIRSMWRQLRDKLGVFPDICDREMAKASQVQLSLLPNGDAIPPASLEAVTLVREIVRRQHGIAPAALATLATRTVGVPVAIPNPAAQKQNTSFAQKMLQKATGNPDAKLAAVS